MTKERDGDLGSEIMFVVRKRVRFLGPALPVLIIGIAHPISIFNQCISAQLNPYVANLRYAWGLYFRSKYFKLLQLL